MKTLLFISTCYLFGILCACQDSQPVQSLSADKFEELINDYSIQRVDVRTAAEYSEGHISGAININVMDEHFEQIAEELLSKEAPVAVYCKSGRRSKMAAQKLIKAGYEVYDLDEGIQGWKKAGKEIVK